MSARGLLVILAMGCILLLAAGCSGAPLSADVDGHLVMLPRVMRAGETALVGCTLLAGEELARGDVRVSLSDAGSLLARAQGSIAGKGAVSLDVPQVPAGEYQVEVAGPGFQEEATVRVEPGTVVLLETDKPIYQSGQTVRIRVVTLDSSLLPDPAQVELEVVDGEGIAVFRKSVVSDQFGMASLELPLSSEPNLGVWQLTASAGDSSSKVDIRVDESVAPTFQVQVVPSRDWFLAGEPLEGTVSATHTYGRPVRGQMQVTAWRFAGGRWEEHDSYSGPIDGESSFRLDPIVTVPGDPQAGGPGTVRVEANVVEEATGYQETVRGVLSVVSSPLRIRIVTESVAFKPSLPFSFLLVTDSPAGEAVESSVVVEAVYHGADGSRVGMERHQVETRGGSALVRLAPPDRAARMEVTASMGSVVAGKVLATAYSPSGSFVHVEQFGSTSLHVGDAAVFTVHTTSQTPGVHYQVVSRDRIVLTDSTSGDIQFRITPGMTGTCRLLVYQVLPTGEVVADSLPFSVEGEYPQKVTMSLSAGEAQPGAAVELRLRTEGEARVGLTGVDDSVMVLSGNRLNLQQVIDEIERLHMAPQVELGEVDAVGPLRAPGALDAFTGAGLLVLSNKDIPAGETVEQRGVGSAEAGKGAAGSGPGPSAAGGASALADGGLAEVQWVRQYSPETWIWEEVTTGRDGKATLSLEVPDAITNWNVRAVAVSTGRGLGVAETSLRAFQPFLASVNLPYSAVRGEQVPVRVALQNYTAAPQEFAVEIEASPWFELLSAYRQTVLVAANDEGFVEFVLRPATLGTQVVRVTARSGRLTDAVNKSMVVEGEGFVREVVSNAVVEAGSSLALDLSVPASGIVSGSVRTYLAVSGNLLAQSVAGSDQALQPLGCAKQNMARLAPAGLILRYLQQAGRLAPDAQARAERLLLTDYQRELTYRNADGSFSAFGGSDEQGSLFLTASALKTMAELAEFMDIHERLPAEAGEWIAERQQSDGSFESVGFVPRQELMGGARGREALTAYVTVALLDAGMTETAQKAIVFLESAVDRVSDPYALALVTYALVLGRSESAAIATERLLSFAAQDESGLYWSSVLAGPATIAAQGQGGAAAGLLPGSGVEATAYAALALNRVGDKVNAAKAVRWLVGKRNSAGGFATTQDTVVALQALAEVAAAQEKGSDLTVRVSGRGVSREVKFTSDNFDGVEVIEAPMGSSLDISVEGEGEAVVQAVVRYNLLAPLEDEAFDLGISYDAVQINVGDVLRATAEVAFNPPEPFQGLSAGVVVVDIAVPTGFEVVQQSLTDLMESPYIKRCDPVGRRVLVYIEDMAPGQRLSLSLMLRALYAVKATGTASQVYACYRPEWRDETLSETLTVR